jgi:hypothetical protein
MAKALITFVYVPGIDSRLQYENSFDVSVMEYFLIFIPIFAGRRVDY